MAKEFQMLFRLGAKLGENFNGTFSSAQKVLQATQKEVQAFNKLQSDVNAYQRQQEGITKTNEKLAMYQRELANVRKEMSQSSEFSSTLANREEELKNKIANTEDAIVKKNQRLSEMRANLSEAGVNVNDLAGESQRLEAQMRELQKQEEQAAAEAVNFGSSGVSAIEAVSSALAATGIAAGLSKVKEAYTECVSAAMEFGGTMSTVEALSGASASEMAALSQSAKEYGANTVFTANQSASAMTYMGMAGWDATQMISGLPGVLNLAAASGEDLANTSDIVTDNLTAFNLKASDTAHFADVLAAAATNSNTSVGIMGETFKSSASIAGALGYSIEDVATAVGLMANAGVKGSVAGTALKNTFNGLLNGATLTAAAFGEVEYTAVNADGTMKDFGETCNELRGYFAQMTEAERVQNAMLLAGQRGYNGLLAILNATEEDYQKVTDSINNCSGAAQRMANIKLDNLQGDVTLLNSASDGLKMTLGGMYDKEMRQLAQIGTKILGGINEFCEKNPAVVKAIMKGVAAIGAGVAVYTAVNTVKKTKNALDTIGAALQAKNAAAAAANAAATSAEAAAAAGAATAQTAHNRALLASPIAKVTIAVAALTAGLTLLREASKQEAFEEQELTLATKQQRTELAELRVEYQNTVETYGETSDRARALKYDVDEATAAFESQKFSVKDLYSEIDGLHSSTESLLSGISSSTAEIDSNYESAQVLIAKLRELTSSSDKSATSQAKIEPIIKRLNQMYPSLGLTVENVASKMSGLNNEVEKTSNASGWEAKVKAANENLADLYVQQKQLADAKKKADEAQLAAGKKFSEAMGDSGWAWGWKQYITKEIPNAEKAYDQASEEYKKVSRDLSAVNQEIERQEAILTEYGEVVSGTSDKTVSAYDAMSIAANGIAESAEALIQSYNNAYQAAYDSISGQYALWDEAAEISEMDVDNINDSLSSQAEYWNTYNENINKLLTKSDEIDGLREIIATFADGSADSVNAIAGLADASTTDDDLKLIVENWKKVQEAQEKTAGSLAETKVDFEERLNEIQSTMADTVQKMNMDDEARKAATDTIQAYAEGLIAGKGSVVEAGEIVKSAVLSALTNSALEVTPQSESANGQTSSPMLRISDVDANLRGYAVGTDYAERGLALVGERGPELVNFNGGEQVLTADKTNALLSRASGGGGGNTITIAPVIQISGNADSDTIQQAVDEAIERIQDALREADIDVRRGAYA